MTGYAYETVVNKPILTGDRMGPTQEVGAIELRDPLAEAASPATLGALAQGAPALDIWRREEETTANKSRSA